MMQDATQRLSEMKRTTHPSSVVLLTTPVFTVLQLLSVARLVKRYLRIT